jgi:hypothetical protein
VHAKVVARHTSTLRRIFVQDNVVAVSSAIHRLLASPAPLSQRDSGFLLLAAYLSSLQSGPSILLKALVRSNVKNIAIAIAKIARGF